MSIDKLIKELEKENKDLSKIKEFCKKTISDYLGIAHGNLDLLKSEVEFPQKVNLISAIVMEAVSNIQALNKMMILLNDQKQNPDELDMIAGQILKGEQVIDSLISQIEETE